MSAGELDLEIEQGTTFLSTVTLQNDDLTPVDLTGFSLKAQIRETPNNAILAAEFTIDNPSPATGSFDIYLTPTQTSAIKAHGKSAKDKARYVWDIELTDGAGRVSRLLQGFAFISPEVTR